MPAEATVRLEAGATNATEGRRVRVCVHVETTAETACSVAVDFVLSLNISGTAGIVVSPSYFMLFSCHAKSPNRD